MDSERFQGKTKTMTFHHFYENIIREVNGDILRGEVLGCLTSNPRPHCIFTSKVFIIICNRFIQLRRILRNI